MFWQNEEYSMGLGRDIHLDGVVCVVDAVFGLQVCIDNALDPGFAHQVIANGGGPF